eukprot:UC1_evm2s753
MLTMARTATLLFVAVLGGLVVAVVTANNDALPPPRIVSSNEALTFQTPGHVVFKEGDAGAVTNVTARLATCCGRIDSLAASMQSRVGNIRRDITDGGTFSLSAGVKGSQSTGAIRVHHHSGNGLDESGSTSLAFATSGTSKEGEEATEHVVLSSDGFLLFMLMV